MIKVSSAEELKSALQKNKTMRQHELAPGEINVTINFEWIVDEIIKRKGYICSDTLQVLGELNVEQYEVK